MSKDRHIIVVEARPESLRLCFLRIGGGAIDCADICSFFPNDPDTQTSSLLDQLILDDAATAVRDHSDWRGAEVFCLIGGGDVACHYFSIPGLEGKALIEAVRLKLGQQLHFSIDDAVVDVRSIGTASDSSDAATRVRAVAIARETAEAAVAFAQQIRCPLTLVSTSAAAIAKLVESSGSSSDEAIRAVFQVDHSHSVLVVTAKARPLLTAELPVGLGDFTQALMRPIIAGDDVHQLEEPQAIELRDRIGIPAPNADIGVRDLKGKSLLPLLEPALQRFAQQLTQWLTFAATAEDGGTVSNLSLVGTGAAMPGLSDALAKRLKLDVDKADWLGKLGRVSTHQESGDREPFAAACAAVTFEADLPDLLPAAERRRRRIARFRSSTTKAGPIIAAATLGIAFLFNQVGGHLSEAVGEVEGELTRVQSVVDNNTQLQQEQRMVTALKGEFDEFSRATPNWIGLLKEVSLILPREVRVTRFSTRPDAAGLRVVIQGDVVRSAHGLSFDEVVEITLTALERSPFVETVDLMNSSRGNGANDGVVGTLAVELSLAYERPAVSEEP